MTLFSRDNKEKSNTEKENQKITLGTRISQLRKKNGLTQEDFAEKLGVTAQAVSKWENDISCPDIMLLPEIAKIFSISIDELMGVKRADTNFQEPQTDVDKLKVCIHILKPEAKPVNISVPVSFVLKTTNLGLKISAIMGNENLNNVPFDKIIELVKNGVTGEVFDLTTEDGTNINIEIS